MAGILEYLTQKPTEDEAALARFDARFHSSIADIFQIVLQDWREQKHREYMLKGGRGSCKSSFVGCLIVYNLKHNPKANALIVRRVANTIRKSVYTQMEWCLEHLGVYDEWDCTVSPPEMTHKVTGQKIIFAGLDDPQKLKSIKLKRGYFSILWFEEGQEYESYPSMRSVLQSAGRGKGSRMAVFITYNPPRSANHWLNKEALENKPSRLVHHSCYTDVPQEWLGETFLQEAEELKRTNYTAWRHEYGGEPIGDGGNVFKNLQIRPITAEERLHLPVSLGLDFGYANDPSALMTVSYRADKTLFILEEYYKAGAGFDALEKACKEAYKYACKHESTSGIWADTEPRTIAELHSRGIPIYAARKGRGSRLFGIEWLADLHAIIIDGAHCPNAAREFAAFEYARNPDGSWRADYQDGDDHTIDATRYACWKVINRNKRKKYHSGKGARV